MKFNTDQIVTLNKLVDKYGDQQINICIEEMSELTKALCKHIRGKTDLTNIKEELADVYIMLYQIMILFEVHPHELMEVVDYKIKRTKERLLNEQN